MNRLVGHERSLRGAKGNLSSLLVRCVHEASLQVAVLRGVGA